MVQRPLSPPHMRRIDSSKKNKPSAFHIHLAPATCSVMFVFVLPVNVVNIYRVVWAVALRGAKREHTDWWPPPASCTIGRSLLTAAVGEEQNRNRTVWWFLCFKNQNRTEFLKIETVTALMVRALIKCAFARCAVHLVKCAHWPNAPYNTTINRHFKDFVSLYLVCTSCTTVLTNLVQQSIISQVSQALNLA